MLALRIFSSPVLTAPWQLSPSLGFHLRFRRLLGRASLPFWCHRHQAALFSNTHTLSHPAMVNLHYPLMHVTPGISYISRTLAVPCILVASVYMLMPAVEFRCCGIPRWLIASLCVPAVVIGHVFIVIVASFREKWEAAARNATLPHQIPYSYVFSPRGPPGSKFLGMSLRYSECPQEIHSSSIVRIQPF